MARTPLWVPFLTNSNGFDNLSTDTHVIIDIASIADAELDMQLTQYTTRRVVFTMLLENQTTDIQVGLGIRFRTEGLGASNAPAPVVQAAHDWQFHEYVVNGSTDDFPTVIRRDVTISRRMRAVNDELMFSIENRTTVTVAYWVGGRALILRQ